MMETQEDGIVALCRPFTTTHFTIERAASINGIHAEVRHFGWNYSCDALFEANAHYIDYSLIPRPPHSRLFHPGRRDGPAPGGVVFIPDGCRLHAHNDPCEQRLFCLTLERGHAQRMFEDDIPVHRLAPCFDVHAPRVRAILARLAEEVREPGFGHFVLLESMTLSLFVELYRHLRSRQDGDRPHSGQIAGWRLNRLRERIQIGLSTHLSVADLAAECGMSPRHLIRTFRNTTGMTLSDYIVNARIEHAKTALIRDDLPIKVIASNCGFQSAAAFSASFRRATGVTPRAYRQERYRRQV